VAVGLTDVSDATEVVDGNVSEEAGEDCFCLDTLPFFVPARVVSCAFLPAGKSWRDIIHVGVVRISLLTVCLRPGTADMLHPKAPE